MIVSVLFWTPMIRGMTRSITQMTHAAERIAEGHFERHDPGDPCFGEPHDPSPIRIRERAEAVSR